MLLSICLLFSLPAAGYADSATKLVAQSGNGTLYDMNGVRLLVLSGTFNEMGRQYGALLGKDIARLYDLAIDRAFIKSGMFTQEELDNFAANSFKTMPVRQKELIRGMAATSGLSKEKTILASDLVMVQILARKKFGGNTAACTSVAAWGKHTTDGKVVTARNFDFPNLFRSMLKDFGTVVVFNPTDGSNSVAGLGLTGSIYFVDAINSKGIYTEVNNAADSAGLVMFSGRTQTGSQLINLLFDADDAQELYTIANSTRFGYSAILMVADQNTASFCELSCWDSRKREAANNDNVIAAANQFDDPAWGLLSLPSPAAWYSAYRESALLKMVTSTPARSVNPQSMMSILNVPFYNSDGSIGKGVSVIDKNPKDDEVTVWQVITQPESLKLWFRYPALNNWQLVDLNKFFNKTAQK